jgi:hypothetical protein
MADERLPLLPKSSIVRERRKTSKWTSTWRRLLAAGFITFILVIIHIFRRRTHSVPDVIDHEFGIGFHLTVPHGYLADLLERERIEY